MKFTRLITLIMILVFSSFAIAACSPAEAPAETEAPAEVEATEEVTETEEAEATEEVTETEEADGEEADAEDMDEAEGEEADAEDMDEAEGEEEAADEEVSADAIVFSIDPEQSEASFAIDEVLRGEEVTVVGVTSIVSGNINVNVADPAASTIGEIQISARDLTTDQENRNRALRRFILDSNSDENEFITFTPTALNDMPESVEVGTEFTFSIVGDLTIKGETNEVTFDATVTPNSETEIAGSVTTVVMYADWGLSIPDVPFVASVEDDVTLTLNFVATAQ